jgi:transcriptional regulator with XRE-family HTH domain
MDENILIPPSQVGVLSPREMAIRRFGQQLQRFRTRRGLTQEQLAVKAGLVRVYLPKLEQGEQRSDADYAGVLGEGAEGLGDRVIRRERECESVVAGGEDRSARQEEAEDRARTLSEMFIARYQNKPEGPVRRLLPVRETKEPPSTPSYRRPRISVNLDRIIRGLSRPVHMYVGQYTCLLLLFIAG